jgi:hypothetical protein
MKFRLKMRRLFLYLSVALSLSLVSACSTTKSPSQQHEEFGASGVFTRSFPGTEQSACEAARRALLSQGYVISDWKPSILKGRRKYQHDAEVHAEIEFNVVCVANSLGSNSTTIFANAVRDRYSLKRATPPPVSASALSARSPCHLAQRMMRSLKSPAKRYQPGSFITSFLIWLNAISIVYKCRMIPMQKKESASVKAPPAEQSAAPDQAGKEISKSNADN